jgi:hypothetical protein
LVVEAGAMTARRHHYIPQCYLKGFAEDRNRPKLFVVDTKERRSFFASTKNIAVEADFHRIDAPSQPLDALENKLAEFESTLSPAVERIIAAKSISNDEDASQVFMLMSLLFLKNPRMRDRVDQMTAQIGKLMLGMMADSPERWQAQMERAQEEGTIDKNADIEALRTFVLKDEFSISMTTPGHLDREFNSILDILPYIVERKWILCKAPPDTTGFVTTDSPVSLMWQNPKEHAPPGLGLMKTQIVFSISKELAIIGAFEFENDEIEVDADFVSVLNGNLILHSNRQVYARDDDFTYGLQHHTKAMRGTGLLNDPLVTCEPVETSG